MRDAAPQTIYLKEYRAPSFWVDDVHLTFVLHPTATRVRSKVTFRPNPEAPGPFHLHGEDLTLISAQIDGAPISLTFVEDGLTCDVPDAPSFVFEAEVEINPEANTALEGLYLSNGMFCTQCEAQGFRKITYYPDRPDVMAPFTVRVEGTEPVMLSNGNPGAQGAGFAEWHDPWPKPAYLFALVAGDLLATKGSFTTMEGRDVDLAVYVRKGDEDKTAFAMEALKLSMKWDEDVYKRPYDLDVFNIVAVDDFNMGAMENKGLNIFNSSAVLASPSTATDSNFERIEAIIAHEYFHNWTGNRITCRDWFQLCLKEGLTVFRDQQFTADVRSRDVARINDVAALRGRQFREDAGPLAHPVRPESFVEINNFYTATVYEKGAEIIGMLKRLVGDEMYDTALQLYFERHDGDAATIEDWLKVFEDATGRDFSHFQQWYSQAGTPQLTVTDSFENGTYTLHFSQETKPTPGQPDKAPQVLPITVGLLDAETGAEHVASTTLEMTKARQSFDFTGLSARPVPSILRQFSAPVVLKSDALADHRPLLLAHDTDAFTRWEAARTLGRDALHSILAGQPPSSAYLNALKTALTDERQDPDFRSQLLALPSHSELVAEIAAKGGTPDPEAIYQAVETLRQATSEALHDDLAALYAAHQVSAPYEPSAEQIGHRSFANAMLGLITRLDGGKAAQTQYDAADNMTNQLASLSALLKVGKGAEAAQSFYAQWQHERLVIDKWFGIQIAASEPDRAVSVTKTLTEHPDFTAKNPNRFRATLGALAGNTPAFHQADGSGYALLADWLITLDAVNPQTTARMTSAFETWRLFDEARQSKMRGALARIKATPGLSRDTTEMVTRLLGD
ncbi:MAG: aminopeptidase N [Pseudomonadota bacterium]